MAEHPAFDVGPMMAQLQDLAYEEEEDDDDDDFDDDDNGFDDDDHPIFDDIARGDLEAVRQRVLADPAVLEIREIAEEMTPLMSAICCEEIPISLWLIEHRGQHDLEATDHGGDNALHLAASCGLVEIVRALVAAGANAAALTRSGLTALMCASEDDHADIVAFLVQVPAVKASIDHINPHRCTALSIASADGRRPTVQLLLDAGANPTIPPGPFSPVRRAYGHQHHGIVALLRLAIDEPERARALQKARCLLGAGAVPAWLQGRVGRGQAMPLLELPPDDEEEERKEEEEEEEEKGQQQHPQQLQQQDEKLRATAAFAVGVSGGESRSGLSEQLFVELMGYMLPVWADNRPTA